MFEQRRKELAELMTRVARTLGDPNNAKMVAERVLPEALAKYTAETRILGVALGVPVVDDEVNAAARRGFFSGQPDAERKAKKPDVSA